VPTFAVQERQALADALLEVGPDAPTLCEGWDAHDLAAHVVAREHRGDASAGLVIPLLAGYTERVRLRYRRRPFGDLVEQLRSGPPRFSLFAVPGVDAAVNLGEYFVHCEDVRRAAPSWEPRDLPDAQQERFWTMLRTQSRLAFRRSPVGVVLVRPDGERVSVGADGPHVVLTGDPGELLFYSFNRTTAARVALDGPAEAVRQFRAAKLGL
jgi:uncharacterized protein (TIGR03085 family)